MRDALRSILRHVGLSDVFCTLRHQRSQCGLSFQKRRVEMNRRRFLSGLGYTGLSNGIRSPALLNAAVDRSLGKADVELRIALMNLEIAPGKVISTRSYNNSVPGPLLRFRDGQRITVDVHNDTNVAETVHWHGQPIAPAVDGSEEEGTPMVEPHSSRRYRFKVGPSGTRWYHTHTMSHGDLSLAGFTGQYGFVIIEPASHPGDYDQEIPIAFHHWEPKLVRRGSPSNGWEVDYDSATFNDKMLGAGEPIRVREGQRVLFRLLNASATDDMRVALPGHQFRIIAMDGNPVPRQQTVDMVFLDVGERVDAIVEMNNPGVWVFGSAKEAERKKGMGVVVEYANKTGEPQWRQPEGTLRGAWDYTQFSSGAVAPEPDHIIEMNIDKVPGNGVDFNHWTINGQSFPRIDRLRLERGKRYRLAFKNIDGDVHPLHIHRHLFEITEVNGKPMAGLRKDVVSLDRRGSVAVDFTADNPGLSLFHCHMQLHMDYGFMQLFEYVG